MKKLNIYRLLRDLRDGIIQRNYRSLVQYWLVNKEKEAEKDNALFRIWNETDEEEVSEEDTLKSLNRVKSRLGLDVDSSAETHVSKKPWNFSLNYDWMRYAAILVLPLISAALMWLYMDGREIIKPEKMIECFVPNGEERDVFLADGTKVTLNSGTLLIYPEHFTGNERKVYLSGEAFFDVTRNEHLPFTVHTGRLNVEVLGTRFNVEAYADESENTTTLEQGKVKVSSSNRDVNSSIVMKPNEQVVYNTKNGRMELSVVDAADYSSWKDGELRFIQRPLANIMKVISRKYDVTFRYDEILDVEELYTINFNQDESIERIMKLMISLIGDNVRYTISNDSIYLYVE